MPRYKDIESKQRFTLSTSSPYMIMIRHTGILCKCVEQVGYRNTRGVNALYSISPQTPVFLTK